MLYKVTYLDNESVEQYGVQELFKKTVYYRIDEEIVSIKKIIEDKFAHTEIIEVVQISKDKDMYMQRTEESEF